MIKKIISVVTAVAMLAGLPMAYAADNGSGTEADPYIVSTAEEWTAATKKGYIKLNGDITIATAKTGGEMTLDLNGHTLEVTDSAFEVAHNFTLTDSASAKGKLLNSNSGSGTYALKFAAKNVTANVENAVVASTNGQAVMVNAVNTTVNINL